jgi:hypothetical protein
MNLKLEAEQNLQIIRSLLERASAHRAISSATALIGGIFSAALAFWQVKNRTFDLATFLLEWGGVLLVTALANAVFLWLNALRRGGPFFSRGFRLTILGAAPCLASGAVLSLVLSFDSPLYSSLLWMLFYGLALLSTRTFAPASILVLGTAFVGTSLGFFLWLGVANPPMSELASGGAWLMGASFGGFHLLYAVCTWPRQGGFLAALDPQPENP